MYAKGLITMLTVALLSAGRPTDSQEKCCEPDAPRNCTFYNGNPCGWTTTGNYVNDHLVLSREKNITSGKACWSTNATTAEHCLSFDCSLNNTNSAVLNFSFVSFYQTNPGMGTCIHYNSQTPTWLTSLNLTNAQWNSYQVPLNYTYTSGDDFFTLSITATIDNGNWTTTVLLDNLTYSREVCPTPPSPTTKLPTSSIMTMTTTTPATATPTNNVSNSQTTPSAAPSTTTEHSETSPPAADALASSSNVGTIVGAVVAVIVLLAVIVIVFVVLARRRGKDFWKTWFNKKNRESTQKPGIRMNGMPHANDQTLRPNGDFEPSNTAQSSSEDDYSVIHDSDGSFSPSGQSMPYTQVNKPHKEVNNANSDLPPLNLAPGFEYNHLDFGNRPATKTGSKPTANQNYSNINTSAETSADGAYSLAQNSEQQNSASRNESNYQEPLKAAGVYHILDSEPGNRESASSTGIYHVPDDGDNTNPSDDPRSSSVYHETGDVSKPGRSHNANSIYYNPDDPKYSTQLASGGVYHTLESDPPGQRSSTGIYHVPDASSSNPQPPRKPVGVYEVAKNPGDAPKKPASPPKPNTGNSVYHVLEPETKPGQSPKSGVGATANYEIAEPLDSSDTSSSSRAPSNSVYQLANASGYPGPQQNKPVSPYSGSKEGDYNSLDLSGKKLSKTSTSDADTGAVYSHLNEAGEDTYNELNRGRKAEVINDEYSHLGKQ